LYQNKVRITGGNLKGSYVNILNKASKVKPTKSYIREVIFNTIPSVSKFHCLDLFSGSGILSVEAFSRGAKEITLIEKDKSVCKMIEKQFNLLKIDKYNLLQGDVLEFLKKECKTQYDLIFIDPPYDGKLLQESLNLLQMYRYFIGCSYLFFEQINDKQNKTNLDFMNRDWIILKDLSIGEVSYTIAKKRE